MDALVRSLWVGFGGALGAMARFWIGELIGRGTASNFPVATLLINIVGSLAIGVFYAWEMQHGPHFAQRLFFAVGICGGFTTFSTFSWESLRMMEKGEWFQFGAYALSSLILTIGACAIGFFATRSVMA